MAIDALDEAVRLAGYDYETYTNRAMTHLILDQTQKALADLDEIIRCATTSPCPHRESPSLYAEAYSNRGFVYRELGQPQRAIEDLDEAIRLDPKECSGP